MNREEIIEALEELAQWLELKGENPFKIRAYHGGARALETLEEDLDTLIEEKQLDKVEGIGKALAEKITTLRKEGKLPLLEELRNSFPPGLRDLFELSGLGSRKIKILYEKLEITGLPDLKKACEEHRVAELDGFAKKSEEKLLQAIAQREANAQRHLWWEAWQVAQPILKQLRELPSVEQAEVAGSLRRARETIGDLDFIVGSDDPEPIMRFFCELPGTREVLAHGNTKSSIRMGDGLQADLRVVPPDRFGYALHHFTGSKEHNVQMRQRALSMGYSLSEWGLFHADEKKTEGGEPVRIARNEQDLFETLKLTFIPPELREAHGEIEAAESNKLPTPLEFGDLTGVFHNHTKASDGNNSLAEMAKAAASYGWEYLGIADHSKASFQANGLNEEQLMAQVEEIKKLNQSSEHNIALLSGVECDILKEGDLDFDRDILSALDYVVGSVHQSLQQDEKVMTARLIKAIESGLIHILGHPTGRLLLRREGSAVNLAKIIDAAHANQVAIELNANPWRLDMDWRYWRRAAEKGVLCAINPDAHQTGDFEYTRNGVLIARKGWLEKEQILNCRPLSEVRKFFQR